MKRSLFTGFSWILMGLILGAALPADAQPIRLHPDNPHYFLFRGRPTVLITNGEHYGAVINLDFNYSAYLDHLQSKGMNLTRLFSGSYLENEGNNGMRQSQNTLVVAANRLVVPWARSSSPGYIGGGNKLDLNAWDPHYFSRLRDFVQQAGARGVVVEVVLFSRMYDENTWHVSPLYAANNINGVGTGAKENFLTLADAALVTRQLALTRKIVQELSGYDNVYFEVANEPDSTVNQRGVDWHDRIIQEIVAADSGSAAHMIAVNYDTPYALERIHPAVSINNVHYTWADDWIGAVEALDGYFHPNIALAFDESWPVFFGGHQSIDGARTEAWEFLVGGGGVYSGLSLEFTTGAPTGNAIHDILLGQLRGLKNFLNGFDLLRMSPQKWLVTGIPSGAQHRVLAQTGKQYAIYVHHGQRGALSDMIYAVLPGIHQANLAVELPAGDYDFQWINPITGVATPAQRFTHTGGNRAFSSPVYPVDIALSIRAAGITPSDAPVPLFAATGLTGTPVSSSKINLSWTASASTTVTGYRIFRNDTAIGTSLTPAYQDVDLAANTAYAYRVTAFDGANQESAGSSVISVTTPAAMSGSVLTLFLNEGTGTNVSDSSGNGNNGALLNDPVWTTSKSGAALAFDGINDTLYVSNSPTINSVTTGVTVAAWVYRSANQGGVQSVISRQAGDTQLEHFYLGFEVGTYRWFISTSSGYSDYTLGSAAPLGEWVHLVGTYDGSNVKLYVNGVLDFTSPHSGVFAADFTGIVIGASHNDAAHTSGEAFNGRIDDVSVYRNALTDAEVAQLYQSSNSEGTHSVPAVNLRLNEGTGTLALDASGHGNHASLLNDTAWTTGKSGMAVNLDGINDTLYVPNNPSLSSATRGITVAAWVYRNTNQGGVQSIISRQSGDSQFEHYYLGFQDGKCRWYVRTANGYSDYSLGSAVPVGEWVHLVGTYDGSNVRLYINGVLDFITPKSGGFPADFTGIAIGAGHNDASHTPGEMFNGRIDEVSIYPNAVTDAEVTKLYQGMNSVAFDSVPTVTITSPSAGQSVKATISVTATTSDPGVAAVQFQIDGLAAGIEDTVAPYSVNIDTTRYAEGEHILTAIARDAIGRVTSSGESRVIFDNIALMPMGDSLTYGFVYCCPDSPNNQDGGYRRYLWEKIRANGFSDVNFVGAMQTGIPNMDRDHAGHSGWTIADIASALDAWLSTYSPDTILLLIGTNDLNQGRTAQQTLDSLSGLLDRIHAGRPTARILLANNPGVRIPNEFPNVRPQAVNEFNAGVPALVNSRLAQGWNIRLVDLYGQAGLDRNSNSTDYSLDGLHFSATGYSKLADAWYAVLYPTAF